jgi:serine protease inhibitor
MHSERARRAVVLAAVVALVAGCSSSSPSSPPGAGSPAPSQATVTATPAAPTAAPSATSAATSAPTPTAKPVALDPFVGKVAVTVSDNLVVRSEPRVSDDSIMYKPWLPTGTELKVLDGPVSGSGYTWYEVTPVSFTGLDGPGHGWVALAGKDGEPWIALPEPEIAGIELAKADVPRAPADPAAAKTAAASINAFGLDLLRAMLADGTLKPDENAVFSPTSIALALAMARAGAKGETASQMDAVLHATGWEALGPGLNALDQALASRNATWQDEDLDPPTRELALRIANAAFAQRDWAIERAYLERIASTFGAGVRLVDYVADYEAARKTINAWVSDQTKKRIPELIPENILNELSRFVLVNAIYLKAGWENEFSKGATEPKPFTRLDGSLVKVPTMRQWGGQTIPYARGNGWQATELRYRGGDWTTPLAMTLILPDDLPSFESTLSASQLGRITATLESERERIGVITPGTSGEMCDMGTWPYAVEVFLPRFSAGTQATLADVLKSLGMPVAFTGGVADFTAIHVPKTPGEQLFIGTVIHQANIDVDEKGTEAAAATAIIMQATGGGCVGTEPSPRKTITLRLDHPFLFVLRDVETGAVLFMGRVVDPSVGR